MWKKGKFSSASTYLPFFHEEQGQIHMRLTTGPGTDTGTDTDDRDGHLHGQHGRQEHGHRDRNRDRDGDRDRDLSEKHVLRKTTVSQVRGRRLMCSLATVHVKSSAGPGAADAASVAAQRLLDWAHG